MPKGRINTPRRIPRPGQQQQRRKTAAHNIGTQRNGMLESHVAGDAARDKTMVVLVGIASANAMGSHGHPFARVGTSHGVLHTSGRTLTMLGSTVVRVAVLSLDQHVLKRRKASHGPRNASAGSIASK